MQGEDVYIFERHTGGMLKVSLHKTGDWRIAWTSGWVEKGGSTSHTMPGHPRLIHRWSRPREYTPGWTQGPAIFIPAVRIDEAFPAMPVAASKRLIIEPAAAPGNMLHFTVLFSAAGVPHQTMRGATEPTDRPVDSRRLVNGQTVWIFRRESPQPLESAAKWQEWVDGINIQPGDDDPTSIVASTLLNVVTHTPHPALVDLTFGRSNVRLRAET